MVKARARAPLAGIEIALEIDDVHKQNFLLCEATGDLRYVDEEGIGLRPRGMGLASFVKTMTKAHTIDRYREGYARAGDASFLDNAYLELLVLLDTARRVGHKSRTGVRPEKLAAECEGLRAMASTPELCLDWCFPRETLSDLTAPQASAPGAKP